MRKGERKKSTPKKKKKRGSLCEQFVLLLMMEPFWYNVTHQLVIKESWKIFHFFFFFKKRAKGKKNNILGERYYIVGTIINRVIQCCCVVVNPQHELDTGILSLSAFSYDIESVTFGGDFIFVQRHDGNITGCWIPPPTNSIWMRLEFWERSTTTTPFF